MTTTPQSTRRPSYDVRVIRIATSVMSGLLVGIAVATFWRRHVGAFQIPLSTMMFLFVGLTIIGPTILLRHWWRHATRSCSEKIPMVETVWTLYTPTVSLVTILVTISVPGTSPLGISLVGLLFLIGELTIYRPQKRPSTRNTSPAKKTKTMTEEMIDDMGHDLGILQEHPEVEEAEPLPKDCVSQQLTRCRTEDGRDCLHGWLRVDIPAGLRTQNVHLAFCPAFENPPKIEVEAEGDNPKNRIKTVQCLSYGAHLEVKLSQASPTDETLTLRFQATSQGASRRV